MAMTEQTHFAPIDPCGAVPQFLTEKQTAKRLCVTPACLRKWRRENRGPRFLRLSTRIVYAESDIIIWLNSCPSGGGRLAGGMGRIQ
jgi:hypothetical protein